MASAINTNMPFNLQLYSINFRETAHKAMKSTSPELQEHNNNNITDCQAD